MSSAAVRTWLQRQLQSSGIQIESGALKLLARSLDEITNSTQAEAEGASPERLLSALLDDVETRTDDRKLTILFVEEFLQRWMQGNQDAQVEVVDAFDVPLVQYDPVRHQWFQQNSTRSVIGNIKSKTQLYEDRFLLIQQRLKRNALFRPSKWAKGAGSAGHGAGQGSGGKGSGGEHDAFHGASSAELIELKALLGHERQRRFVCGFLTKHEEGQYFIEDLSARLPIDLSGCDTVDGLFTENCVVVAEGELQPSGEFRAVALGLPPAESREDSIDALQGHDTFGGRPIGQFEEDVGPQEDDGDRIVVLSEVHLDDPRVMDNLAMVLDGFSVSPKTPSAFVLMGNFQTFDANGPRSKLSKLKENFTRLGRLLRGYPRIVSESQIILVPGPKDIGPGTALPRGGIPMPLVEGLKEVVPGIIMSSNPCRIRFRGAELALFRSDLQQKLRGLCILPPPMPKDGDLGEHGTGNDGTLVQTSGQFDTRQQSHASFFFDQTCSTVIQESHMCPVPLEYQPIAWEFDHAMYIYPNPHGLVLADSEPAARSIFDTCDCLNPGSLASGTFGAWNPATREMELCDVHAASMAEHELAGELGGGDAAERSDGPERSENVDIRDVGAIDDGGDSGDVDGITAIGVGEAGVSPMGGTSPSDSRDDGETSGLFEVEDGEQENGPLLTAAEQYDAMLAAEQAPHDSEEGNSGDENDAFTLPPEEDE